MDEHVQGSEYPPARCSSKSYRPATTANHHPPPQTTAHHCPPMSLQCFFCPPHLWPSCPCPLGMLLGRPITGPELASLLEILVEAANEGLMAQVSRHSMPLTFFSSNHLPPLFVPPSHPLPPDPRAMGGLPGEAQVLCRTRLLHVL